MHIAQILGHNSLKSVNPMDTLRYRHAYTVESRKCEGTYINFLIISTCSLSYMEIDIKDIT